MTDQAQDIAKLLGAGVGGAAVTAGVSGFWGWLSARRPGMAREKESEAAVLGAATKLQEAMNAAADRAVARLEDEIARLADRVDSLEKENANCRHENEELRGEVRRLAQRGESLERQLKRAGISLERAFSPSALVVVEDDHVTVTQPQRTRSRRGRG